MPQMQGRGIMINEMTNVIIAFVKEKNILHWMWTIEGIAKAMGWVYEEFGFPLRVVFNVMMDISRDMSQSSDPEILATKPDCVIEAERIIEDMTNNPDSIHRQNYDLLDEPPKKEKRNWCFWRN